MGAQKYSFWLMAELHAARNALLAVLEQYDRLRYVEAQTLRQEYMTKIGAYEEEVMDAELTSALLRRKGELIQTAINRRETVDLAKIDEQLARERSEQLENLERADLTADEFPTLSEAQQQELQHLYRTIVKDYHPQMNSAMSVTEKELYARAMDAYQHRNLEALRLIYKMLYDADGASGELRGTERSEIDDMEKKEQLVQQISDIFATDYTLAAALYGCFLPQESDCVLRGVIDQCTGERQRMEQEIQKILSAFPFNAKETLRDPQKTQDYLLELKVRLNRAKETAEELTQQIQAMMGDVAYV